MSTKPSLTEAQLKTIEGARAYALKLLRACDDIKIGELDYEAFEKRITKTNFLGKARETSVHFGGINGGG